MKCVSTIKCTHVIVQIALGCFDEEGNLLGEEMFPRVEGAAVPVRVFHPHDQELSGLIEACIKQAWELLSARAQSEDVIRSADPREQVETAAAASED